MPRNSRRQSQTEPQSLTRVGLAAPADFAESERLIDRQLRRVARRVKWADIVARCCALFSVVTVLLLVAIVCDHWLFPNGLPSVGRVAILAAILVVAVGGIFGPILGIALRRVSPAFAAFMIEQGVPWIKNALLNFVFLRAEFGASKRNICGPRTSGEIQRTDGENGAESQSLPGSDGEHRPSQPVAFWEEDLRRKVLISLGYTAAAQLARVPPHVTVDYTPALRWAYLLVGLWAVVLGYVVLSPKSAIVSMARIAQPWQAIPPATRVTIRDVRPGDTAVEAGSKVTVQAVVRGLRREEKVMLVFRPADGRLQDQARPLAAIAGGYQFEGVLPADDLGVTEDLVYRIEAGDARSPEFRIAVLPPVTIGVKRIRIQPPAYTGLPIRVIEGVADFEALEGSQVEMEVEASEDLAEASLLGRAPLDRRIACSPLGGRQSSVRFTLPFIGPNATRSVAWIYGFSGRTVSGRSLRGGIEHRVDIVPDRPPEVRIVNLPSEQIELAADARLEVKVEAHDPDFGLRRVELWLAAAGKSGRHKALLDRSAGDSPYRGMWQGRAYLTPSELGLRPGERFQAWVVAEDCRQPEPNRVESAKWEVRIAAGPGVAPELLAQSGSGLAAERPNLEQSAEPSRATGTGDTAQTGVQEGTPQRGVDSGQVSGDRRPGEPTGSQSETGGILELRPLGSQGPGEKQAETDSFGQNSPSQSPKAGAEQSAKPAPRTATGQSGEGDRPTEGQPLSSAGPGPSASQPADPSTDLSTKPGSNASNASAGETSEGDSPVSGTAGPGGSGQSRSPDPKDQMIAGEGRPPSGSGAGASPSPGGERGPSSSARVSPADPGEVFERIVDFLRQASTSDEGLRQAVERLTSTENLTATREASSSAGSAPLSPQKAPSSEPGPTGQKEMSQSTSQERNLSSAAAPELGERGSVPKGPENAGREVSSAGPSGVKPGGPAGQGRDSSQEGMPAQAQGGKHLGDRSSAGSGQNLEPGERPLREPSASVGAQRAGSEGGFGQETTEPTSAAQEGTPGRQQSSGTLAASSSQAGGDSTTQSGEAGQSPSSADSHTPSQTGPPKGVAARSPAQGTASTLPEGEDIAGGPSGRKPTGDPMIEQEVSEPPGSGEVAPASPGREARLSPQATRQVASAGGGVTQSAPPETAQPRSENREGLPTAAPPAPAEANLPPKGAPPLPPDNEARSNPEALSPSISRHQAQARGDVEGDRSGGGGAGGGQRAPQPGEGSAGQSSVGSAGTPAVSPGGPELSPAPGSGSVAAAAQLGERSGESQGGGTQAAPQSAGGQSADQGSSAGIASGLRPAERTETSLQSSGRGNPLVGGTVAPLPGGPGPDEPPQPIYQPDPLNVDYAEKVTALVLDYLGRQIQSGQPDKDLLAALGWSEEDLLRFYREWAELRQQALEDRSGRSQEQYRQALRALGLRPGARGLKPGGLPGIAPPVKQTAVPDPPPEWAEYFRAYRASVARGE